MTQVFIRRNFGYAIQQHFTFACFYYWPAGFAGLVSFFFLKQRLNLKVKQKLTLYNVSSFSTGVFGAGKSFLLAVVVLYLVELFKVSDSLNHQWWDEFSIFFPFKSFPDVFNAHSFSLTSIRAAYGTYYSRSFRKGTPSGGKIVSVAGAGRSRE